MKRIILRYSETELQSLVTATTDTNTVKFEGVEVTYPIPNTIVESGRQLNGKRYSHSLYKFKQGSFTISSNELLSEITEEISNNLTFLINFWNAPFKYISFLESYMPSVGNYIQIETEGGVFPITYIDGIKYLPEVTISYEFTGVEA